jgi:hypothetical protein
MNAAACTAVVKGFWGDGEKKALYKYRALKKGTMLN